MPLRQGVSVATLSGEFLPFQVCQEVDAAEGPLDQLGQFRRQAAAVEVEICRRGPRGGLAHERAGSQSSLLIVLDDRFPLVLREPDRMPVGLPAGKLLRTLVLRRLTLDVFLR